MIKLAKKNFKPAIDFSQFHTRTFWYVAGIPFLQMSNQMHDIPKETATPTIRQVRY